MAATYDIQTYLLDRANIHDTITKLPWYYDTRSPSGLLSEVFAPGSLQIDYTSVLGGEPFSIDAGAWTARLADMLSAADGTQHIYTGIFTDLPQPGPNTPRPDRCKAFSQGGASMVVQRARGGPLMQNGGLATFEMVRLPELAARGVNPWRIRAQKVVLAWEKGNAAVLTALEGGGKGQAGEKDEEKS